jgi:hypothetical protein
MVIYGHSISQIQTILTFLTLPIKTSNKTVKNNLTCQNNCTYMKAVYVKCIWAFGMLMIRNCEPKILVIWGH